MARQIWVWVNMIGNKPENTVIFPILYVLYQGLPILMKTPRDKAMSYTIAVVVCVFVVMLATGLVVTKLGGFGNAL